jgi:hypothetical protein
MVNQPAKIMVKVTTTDQPLRASEPFFSFDKNVEEAVRFVIGRIKIIFMYPLLSLKSN